MAFPFENIKRTNPCTIFNKVCSNNKKDLILQLFCVTHLICSYKGTDVKMTIQAPTNVLTCTQGCNHFRMWAVQMKNDGWLIVKLQF